MKRILFAGLVGGVVLFVWGAISHMVLPTGSAGLKPLPNEDVLLAALRESVGEPGLYLYPGFDPSAEMTDESMEEWKRKYAAGPTGLLLYREGGGEPMSPGHLLAELASNVGAALVAAFLLAHVGALAYGRRVLFVALLGVFAWLSLSLSYWIWYGFPGAFTTAEAVDAVGGALVCGLSIAKIVPPHGG